ncbi:MAG: hypothetical protein ACE5LU_19400, partial [Anaerolineae bacterium]
PERKGNRGPHPKPRLEAPAGLQYATVNKQRRKGRAVSVTTQAVYGDQEAIEARLEASTPGVKINISFVERMNGSATLTTGSDLALPLGRDRPGQPLTPAGPDLQQEAGVPGVAPVPGAGLLPFRLLAQRLPLPDTRHLVVVTGARQMGVFKSS